LFTSVSETVEDFCARDRKQVDGEVERRYGSYCDDAIRMHVIVDMILKRKKKAVYMHAF